MEETGMSQTNNSYYNVESEWLALMICIQEAPRSNLGTEKGYYDFPQSLMAMPG